MSLSVQGFVEDQFGLGLIARAVEEGIAIIKPMEEEIPALVLQLTPQNHPLKMIMVGGS